MKVASIKGVAIATAAFLIGLAALPFLRGFKGTKGLNF
jgi:hypothetical protein